jgi:hypothetical protein
MGKVYDGKIWIYTQQDPFYYAYVGVLPAEISE